MKPFFLGRKYKNDIRTPKETAENIRTGQEREEACIQKLAQTVNSNPDLKFSISYIRKSEDEIRDNYRDRGDYLINIIRRKNDKVNSITTDIKANDKGHHFCFKERDIIKCIKKRWPIIYFHLNEKTIIGKFRFFFEPELKKMLEVPAKPLPKMGWKLGWQLDINDYDDWIDFQTLKHNNSYKLIHEKVKEIILNTD